MTTSKSPAAPPPLFSCCTVRFRVARTLGASPAAMPASSFCAVCTPFWAWSMAACRFTDSNWSRIWLNSTRLTITTTVPATTMVIAPMRTCRDARQACTSRPARVLSRWRVVRRVSRTRRPAPRRSRAASPRNRSVRAVGGSVAVPSLVSGTSVVVTGAGSPRSRRACLVPDTAHRQDDLGLLRVALDLRPQPLHVDVDQPGVGGVPVAPHLLEQQLAGEHLARLAGQGHQQVELQRGQLDDLAVPGDLVGRDVDLHVPDRQALGLAGLPAAQLGPDA